MYFYLSFLTYKIYQNVLFYQCFIPHPNPPGAIEWRYTEKYNSVIQFSMKCINSCKLMQWFIKELNFYSINKNNFDPFKKQTRKLWMMY